MMNVKFFPTPVKYQSKTIGQEQIRLFNLLFFIPFNERWKIKPFKKIKIIRAHNY